MQKVFFKESVFFLITKCFVLVFMIFLCLLSKLLVNMMLVYKRFQSEIMELFMSSSRFRGFEQSKQYDTTVVFACQVAKKEIKSKDHSKIQYKMVFFFYIF